jgi:hypothetical protein
VKEPVKNEEKIEASLQAGVGVFLMETLFIKFTAMVAKRSHLRGRFVFSTFAAMGEFFNGRMPFSNF